MDRFIEGKPQRFCTYRIVTLETAARHGEPFAALTRAVNMLPNPVARLCTINLKMRASSALMPTHGFGEWDSVMGIRADEPRRVARMLDPARDNSNGIPVLPNLSAFLWVRRLNRSLPTRLCESITKQDSKLVHGRFPVEGGTDGLRQNIA